MKVEKELKVEDRHRQKMEIDPVKLLKSLAWREEFYHIDKESEKTIYVKGLTDLFKKLNLGVKVVPATEMIVWRGWTWKRGGKKEYVKDRRGGKDKD